MTMTLDSNPQRFGSLNYDPYSPHQPQFTNPWAAPPTSGVNASSSIYSGSSQGGLNPNPLSLDSLTKHSHQPPVPQHVNRSSAGSATSLASYGSVPVPSSSANSPHNLLSLGRLAPVNSLPSTTGYAETPYTTTAAPIHPSYVATSQAPYESLGRYAHSMQHSMAIPSEADHAARRYSQS